MRVTLTADEYNDLVHRLSDGDPEGRSHPRYSGRGMFGDTCFGWATHSGPARVQLELARIWIKRERVPFDADADEWIDTVWGAMEDIGEPSRDGMGLSTIYYWRGINVDPAATDEDDN